MKVKREGRWLIVSFEKPERVLSWAIQGGGRNKTRTVAWYQVKTQELEPPVDAKEFLRARLAENKIPDAVGMLTAADLDAYADVEKSSGNLSSRSIATVGMDNAVRVGDPTREEARIGTINLLCAVSAGLTEEAELEALSVAVEARTAAVLNMGIPSIETGLPATGTGTDCAILLSACPSASPLPYAGKHTVLGHLIGKSVFEAVSLSLHHWMKKNLNKEVFVCV